MGDHGAGARYLAEALKTVVQGLRSGVAGYTGPSVRFLAHGRGGWTT